MRVTDWMTPNPITCPPDMSLYDARELMHRHGFRHLPVVEGRRLMGIITARDVARALMPAEAPEPMRDRFDLLLKPRTRNAMTPDPLTIGRNAPLERAAEVMRRRKVGCLPVVEKGELVGIIVTADVLNGTLEGLGAHRESYRFGVHLPRRGDRPLSQFLNVIEGQGARVMSVMSRRDEDGRPTVEYMIRVGGAPPEKLLVYLKKLGVELDDVFVGSVDWEDAEGRT